MTPSPAAMDLVSELQNQVTALCGNLFNFLGALQRDAPPVSVRGEGVLASGGALDVEVGGGTRLAQNRCSARLVNYPAGARSHPAPSAPPLPLPLQAQTELMAQELLESFSALERLIQRLPATDRAEEAQVREIVALQQANAAASEELRGELAAAQARLVQLQDAFALLADAQLARGGWGPASVAAGAAQPAGGGPPP